MVELATIEGGRGSGGAGLPAVTAPPSPSEWEAMKQQASVIARSGLAPKNVSTPEKVLVIALKGRELSIPPMQALSQIHIVEGKPTLSAELMAALVQRAGHKLRVLETSSRKCVVEGVRADDPRHPSRVEWTIEDARTAGVANKGPWKSYPAAMLRARAISALCRFAFADVLMGASYTPEELGAEVNEEGEVLSLPDRSEAPQRNEEPEQVEEAEVVEDVGGEEVELAMRRIDEALADWPAGQQKPDAERVRAWALESAENARKAVARVQKLREDAEDAALREGAEEEVDEAPFDPDHEPPLDDNEPPPDFEDMRGAALGGPDAKAHKSQVDMLESLCRDLAGEEGVRSVEKQAGKSIAELTVEEADYYIERYSPREGS